MNYRLIIRPLAEVDLKEAVDWYNLKQNGLGDKFLFFVDKKLQLIMSNPFHYQKRFKNIRIAILEKFPYVIHFELKENEIIVFSFYHSHRGLGKLKNRFK